MKPVHIARRRVNFGDDDIGLIWRAQCAALELTADGYTPTEALRALENAAALQDAQAGYMRRASPAACDRLMSDIGFAAWVNQ